jgi:hypothetical protein
MKKGTKIRVIDQKLPSYNQCFYVKEFIGDEIIGVARHKYAYILDLFLQIKQVEIIEEKENSRSLSRREFKKQQKFKKLQDKYKKKDSFLDRIINGINSVL